MPETMPLSYNLDMTKTNKNNLLTVLYLLCLYLACQFVPYHKMSDNLTFQALIKTMFLLVVMTFAVLEIFRNKDCYYRKGKMKSYLLVLPLLLPCFSNIIYGEIFSLHKLQMLDFGLFFMDLILLIVSVVVEEIIFRYFLLFFFSSLFEKHNLKSLLAVLCSASCFSLMHVINFTSGNYSGTALQIVYTFFLGLILGYLAISIDNIVLPIIGHSCFNLFNMLLFDNLYELSEYTISYITVSVAFGIVSIAYLVFVIYMNDRRKQHAS